MGLFKDAHIDTNQFSQLALVFYVTYLAFEMPTGYMMQRFPLAKYLGINVVLWGVCVTLNCVCKSFGSLIAVRVLLGCFESAVAPALILVTTMWYKRHEQPSVRMSLSCMLRENCADSGPPLRGSVSGTLAPAVESLSARSPPTDFSITTVMSSSPGRFCSS